MAQPLSSIAIQLVFSTKNREPWIRDTFAHELHAYVTTVLNNLRCQCIALNGMADHIHVLFCLSRTKTVAEVVEELKTSTSKWIKTQGDSYREFRWQAGYAAFSVSQSNMASVIEYIQHQSAHHRGRSFQDEFRVLLQKHGVGFDEKYVWD